MKTVGTIFLLVGLALGAWGENLALTIEYDNGDPGNMRDTWTARYYTDDQGRLSREVRVTRAEFVGDPDKTEVTTFLWDEKGVSWKRWGGNNSISWTNDGLVLLSSDGGRSDVRVEFGDSILWTDDYLEHRWNKTDGYSSRSMAGPTGAPLSQFTFSTKGARLTQLVDGRPSDFVILNSSPRRLDATLFFGDYLEGTGWVPTGTIVLFGPGLHSAEKRTSIAHAMILSQSLHVPVWPSFVF